MGITNDEQIGYTMVNDKLCNGGIGILAIVQATLVIGERLILITVVNGEYRHVWLYK